MSTLKELFNTSRWRDDNLAALTITVRHRGAPGDQRTVHGHDVVDIRARGLLVRDPASETPTFLPWHRVLDVRDAQQTLYVARR